MGVASRLRPLYAGRCVLFLRPADPAASWWSSAIEQSGRCVGTLFGMMNMVGQFGRDCLQRFVGWFADRQEALNLSGRAQSRPTMCNIYVGALVIGSVGWMVYHYVPLEEEDVESPLATS